MPTPKPFTPPKTDDLDIPPFWLEALNDHFNPEGPAYLTDSIYAVLCNDLHRTFLKCDSTSRRALPHILVYLERVDNRNAWGSKETVDEWVNLKHAAKGATR